MARRVKAEVTGAKEIAANLRSAGQRWQNSLKAALYLEGNNVMAVSKRLVPVDLGTLKASGYVTLPVEQGNKVLVEMGYGGAGSRDYAVPVHERLDVRHEVGGAKYLELAVDERSPQMAQNILKLAQAHFERGGGSIQAQAATPVDPDQGEGRAAAEVIGKVLRKLGGPKRTRKK